MFLDIYMTAGTCHRKGAGTAEPWCWKERRRGEIREGKDGETIILESKDGELRIELDSGKGISIRNGKGDIKIKCRSFSAESEEVTIKAEGLKSGSESGRTKASGGASLESGGDTKLKGKNIRLKGSRGVTAEGKAAARQDDKVTGFDIHQMVVPAGTGTAVIPLPHPFIGQIKGKKRERQAAT